MNPGLAIVKELEELGSPLATMPRVMPFQVPENYFTNITHTIIEAIAYEQEPQLSLPKEMPFEVPQGYFENFAATVLDQVAEVPSFETIAPPAFDVPAGYFQSLPLQMLAAAKAADEAEGTVAEATPAAAIQPKPARVISFMPRRMLQWAVAASLIVAASVDGYKMINNNEPHLSAETQLAQLDKSLIKSYVAQHIDEFDTEMLMEGSPVLNQNPEKSINKLDKSAIQEYLDQGGI